MNSVNISGVTCPKCHWSDFFKVKTCPLCLTAVTATSFPGRGRIVTYTVIRYPPSGFKRKAPYIVGIIDLDDGPTVIGRVNVEPEKVDIVLTVNFSRETAGALEFVPA